MHLQVYLSMGIMCVRVCSCVRVYISGSNIIIMQCTLVVI